MPFTLIRDQHGKRGGDLVPRCAPRPAHVERPQRRTAIGHQDWL
jgi:hypothetical protein